jgi:hypothetical protein
LYADYCWQWARHGVLWEGGGGQLLLSAASSCMHARGRHDSASHRGPWLVRQTDIIVIRADLRLSWSLRAALGGV